MSLKALTNITPTMTGYSSPSPYYVEKGGAGSDSGGAVWKIFDGLTATCGNINSQVASIGIYLGTSNIISEYTILPWDSALNYAPKDWTFEGSNDDSTWKVLDTRTNVTNWATGTLQIFTFANTTGYSYYRINVTATASHMYLGFTEMKLFGLKTTQTDNVYTETLTDDFMAGTLTNTSAANDKLALSSTSGSNTNIIASMAQPAYASGHDNGSYTFTVNKELKVYQLGFYHRWESSTATVSLTGTGVNVSKSVSCSGDTFGYAAITPVLLVPGVTYTLSVSGSTGSYRTFNSSPIFTTADVTIGTKNILYGIPTMSYNAIAYASSGNRLTTLQFNATQNMNGVVSWNANVPANTTLTVQTSINGGSSFQSITNGGSIAGLTPSVTSIQIKELMTTTNTAYTPELYDLTLTATAASQNVTLTSNNQTLSINTNNSLVPVYARIANELLSVDTTNSIVKTTEYILSSNNDLSVGTTNSKISAVTAISNNSVSADDNFINDFMLTYIENTQADFNTGTLTNTTALANCLKLKQTDTRNTATISEDFNDTNYAWPITFNSWTKIDGHVHHSTTMNGTPMVMNINVPDYSIAPYVKIYVYSYSLKNKLVISGGASTVTTSTFNGGQYTAITVNLNSGMNNLSFAWLAGDKGSDAFSINIDQMILNYDYTVFVHSGTRVYQIPMTVPSNYVSDIISWNASLPTNTALTVDVSADGANWYSQSNGSAIAIPENSFTHVWIRENLSTTNTKYSPSLNQLQIQYSSNKLIVIGVTGTYAQHASLNQVVSGSYANYCNLTLNSLFDYRIAVTNISDNLVTLSTNNSIVSDHQRTVTNIISIDTNNSFVKQLNQIKSDNVSVNTTNVINKHINNQSNNSVIIAINNSIQENSGRISSESISLDDNYSIIKQVTLISNNSLSLTDNCYKIIQKTVNIDNNLSIESNSTIMKTVTVANIVSIATDNSIVKQLNQAESDVISIGIQSNISKSINLSATDQIIVIETDNLVPDYGQTSTSALSIGTSNSITNMMTCVSNNQIIIKEIPGNVKWNLGGVVTTDADFNSKTLSGVTTTGNGSVKLIANSTPRHFTYNNAFFNNTQGHYTFTSNSGTWGFDLDGQGWECKYYNNGNNQTNTNIILPDNAVAGNIKMVYSLNLKNANDKVYVYINNVNIDTLTLANNGTYTKNYTANAGSNNFKLVFDQWDSTSSVAIDTMQVDYDSPILTYSGGDVTYKYKLPTAGKCYGFSAVMNSIILADTETSFSLSSDGSDWSHSYDTFKSIFADGTSFSGEYLWVKIHLRSIGQVNTPEVTDMTVTMTNTKTVNQNGIGSYANHRSVNANSLMSYANHRTLNQEVDSSYAIKANSALYVTNIFDYAIHRTVNQNSSYNYQIQRIINQVLHGDYSKHRTIQSYSYNDYAIHRTVSNDVAVNYAIQTQVFVDSAGNYAIQVPLNVDCNFDYGIKCTTSYSFDSVGYYAIHTNIKVPANFGYVVKQVVKFNADIDYAVQHLLKQGMNGNYSVKRAMAAKIISCNYAIKNVLNQNENGFYQLYRALQLKQEFDYSIHKTVNNQAKISYAVLHELTKEIIANYGVFATLTQDIAGNYTTKNTTTINTYINGGYNIHRGIAVQFNGDYYILAVDKRFGSVLVGDVNNHVDLSGMINVDNNLIGYTDGTGMIDTEVALSDDSNMVGLVNKEVNVS